VVLLLFGPPGSGKGTQSALIHNWLRIPCISTGEMLRAECERRTALGCQAHSVLKRGGLVDDDLVNRMLAERIQQADCSNGFLLDGYPRTVAQAVFFEDLLRSYGLPSPVVLHLDAPHSVLIQRLTSRRQCPTCGRIYGANNQGRCSEDNTVLVERSDDGPEVVAHRLRIYEEQTRPVVSFYRTADYHRLDATRTPLEIFAEVETILEPSLVKVSRNRR
jgi:adenylate kinases